MFGHESGHNGQKLTKLCKEPLKNWQNAVCSLDDHNENSNFHKELVLCVINFRKVMEGKSEEIDQQLDKMLNARVESIERFLLQSCKQLFNLENKNIFEDVIEMTMGATRSLMIKLMIKMKFFSILFKKFCFHFFSFYSSFIFYTFCILSITFHLNFCFDQFLIFLFNFFLLTLFAIFLLFFLIIFL